MGVALGGGTLRFPWPLNMKSKHFNPQYTASNQTKPTMKKTNHQTTKHKQRWIKPSSCWRMTLFPDKNTCKTHSCSTKIVTPSLVFCGTSGCLSRTRSSAHGTGSTSQKRRIAMGRSYVIQTTRRSLNYQVFDVGMLDRLYRAYGYTMMNSWQVVLLSEVGMVTSNEWLKKVTTWIIWNFQCFSKFQRFPLSKFDLNMWWKFRKPCPVLWWFCHRNTNQPVFHMFKLSGWFCFPKSESTKGLLLPTLPGSFNGHDALVFQLFWSLKFHCFRSWWQQKAPNIFTKWATD